jgi:hypothetical protein
MAIWQYVFTVIPCGSVSNGSFKPTLDEDGLFETEPYWLITKVSTQPFNQIEQILPKGKSWSENLLVFGDLQSNCFEVLFEGDLVVSVSFRIDYTSDYGEVLSSLIEFCIMNGLSILDEGLEPILMNFESVRQIIESSNQWTKYHRLLDGKSPD